MVIAEFDTPCMFIYNISAATILPKIPRRFSEKSLSSGRIDVIACLCHGVQLRLRKGKAAYWYNGKLHVFLAQKRILYTKLVNQLP